MRRWLLIALAGAVCMGCQHPGPTPVNPTPDADAGPPPVPCSTACAHAAALPCGLTVVSCLSICDRVSINQPAWPGRINAAANCADLKPGATTGGATHGPGGSRTGP